MKLKCWTIRNVMVLSPFGHIGHFGSNIVNFRPRLFHYSFNWTCRLIDWKLTNSFHWPIRESNHRLICFLLLIFFVFCFNDVVMSFVSCDAIFFVGRSKWSGYISPPTTHDAQPLAHVSPIVVSPMGDHLSFSPSFDNDELVMMNDVNYTLTNMKWPLIRE